MISSLSSKAQVSHSFAPRASQSDQNENKNGEEPSYSLAASSNALSISMGSTGTHVKGVNFKKITLGKPENIVRIGDVVFPILDKSLSDKLITREFQLRKGTCTMAWILSHKDGPSVPVFFYSVCHDMPPIAELLTKLKFVEANKEGVISVYNIIKHEGGAILFSSKSSVPTSFKFVSLV